MYSTELWSVRAMVNQQPQPPMSILGCGYFAWINTIMQCNIIHRPEEALDIQSELIFVNGMVHLPQEWNIGTPTILPLPATPPSSLTASPETIFFPYVTSHIQYTMYEIIATCIEHTTMLQTNNTGTCATHEYRAVERAGGPREKISRAKRAPNFAANYL